LGFDFFVAGGIIKSRHSHESGNPGLRTGETFLPDKFPCRQTWISAFAGMTNFRFLFLVFCPCRNDEILSFRNLSGATETAPPSFPRRRESRNEKQQEFIGNDRN
ncbi:TPA: hypothetical protein ACSXSS_002123, partial [Neisseria gonorrhoeae]